MESQDEVPEESLPKPISRRLGTVLGTYAIFSVMVGVVVALLHLYPPRMRVKHDPSFLHPGTESVEFKTSDGVMIRGFFFPPDNDRPVLIFAHGVGMNRAYFVDWARPFARLGCGVLAFDWRAHGESEEDFITYGADAAKDVEAAIRFLDQDSRSQGREIGVVAISLGASSMAMGAKKLPSRARCMVLDSAFGNVGRVLDARLEVLGPLALGPRKIVDICSRALVGFEPDSISPEEELNAFAPRPILVMHGTEDGVIRSRPVKWCLKPLHHRFEFRPPSAASSSSSWVWSSSVARAGSRWLAPSRVPRG